MNKFDAIIFDLDDSLYDEKQFVQSGFNEVAQFLSLKSSYEKEEIVKILFDALSAHGRGKVFDIVLEKINLFQDNLVEDLVNVYRNHEPNIEPYSDTISVLGSLKSEGFKVGLITDGNVVTQKNKVRALKLQKYFDCMIFSDDYGSENQKPSEVPYRKAVELLGVDMQKSVYVGDNPRKDFITAKKLGMYTMRILKGQYKDEVFDEEHEADVQVNELSQVLKAIVRLESTNTCSIT